MTPLLVVLGAMAGAPLRLLAERLAEQGVTVVNDDVERAAAELVKLMGTSAWYAPGAAAAQTDQNAAPAALDSGALAEHRAAELAATAGRG